MIQVYCDTAANSGLFWCLSKPPGIRQSLPEVVAYFDLILSILAWFPYPGCLVPCAPTTLGPLPPAARWRSALHSRTTMRHHLASSPMEAPSLPWHANFVPRLLPDSTGIARILVCIFLSLAWLVHPDPVSAILT